MTLEVSLNGSTDDFSTLCLVRADLSPLSSSAEAKSGKHGKVYWNIIFSVEIHFGLTEFKARIKWVDNVGVFSFLCFPSLKFLLHYQGETR